MKRSREPEEECASPSAASDDLNSPVPTTTTTDADLPRVKIAEIDPDEAIETPAAAMTCLLHRQKLTFNSYDEYEAHHNKEHLNRCLECRRNFPSAHLLSIHIEDCHDPLVALRRDKGEHTYSCFVLDCDRKCGTADKRRRHLIDKHLFPKNFFFAVARDGIDGRRSLLDDGGRHNRRRSSVSIKKEARRKSTLAEAGPSGASIKEDESARPNNTTKTTKNPEIMVGDEPQDTPDTDMDDLAGAMSALKFVPAAVRFGRGGKAGFARR